MADLSSKAVARSAARLPDTLPLGVPARTAAAGLAVIAVSLASINLWRDWYTDPYFATTVQSMRVSWHNFFYLSFDPAGFVSVDKPPLALWLQAACTEVLGFRPIALLLPAALAGLASLAVLYHLVGRSFGVAAGLLAALFLALTPIVVATDRSNNMDSLVVLTSLLGAWAVTLAAERGGLRPLLLCALALGLGFNAKLLQAYVVLPAFALLYLLVPSVPRLDRLVRAGVAAALLLVVSFAWVAAVDLTPAGQRPYVGSSSNNTELDLVLGYNGLSRILPGSAVSNAYAGSIGNDPGDIGPLRLFDVQVGGQIGWLLPLALLGLAVAVRRLLERPPVPRERRGRQAPPAARSPLLLGREGQALLLWGAWLLSLAVLYSVSSYFHPYNLVMLAPAIAAMAAIGLRALWREYRRGEGGWWYLPGSLAVTGLVQAAILLESPDWNRWLLVVVLAGSLGAAGWLVLAMSGARRDDEGRALLATALGTAALLVAPALWASVPVWHYGNVEFPIAGPDLLNPAVEAPAATRDFLAPPILTRYLLAQRHGERYIMAARYGSIAAPLILATGRAVLTYGGYLGEDRILDVPRMAELVRRRQVRLFWMLNARAEAPRAADIEGWVAGRCALVPAARWQVAGQYGATGPRLFDCGRGGSRGQPDH